MLNMGKTMRSFYSVDELKNGLKHFPAHLLRLADNVKVEVTDPGDLDRKADVLFFGGDRTHVQLQA